MNKTITDFPNLYRLIRLMCFANNIKLLPVSEIVMPMDVGIPWDEAEIEASKIIDEEAEIFVEGEEEEMNAIKKKYAAYNLHTILDEIFDGNLSRLFW